MASGTIKNSADVQFDIYDSVADLGLTSGSTTIANAWAAMAGKNVILLCNAEEFSSSTIPHTAGNIMMYHLATNTTRGIIRFFSRVTTSGDYAMGINTDGTPSGTWDKILDGASIIQEAKTITGITVTANSAQSGSVSVAKSGYTPLGVIGVTTSNGYGIPSGCYVSGTTLYYRMTNSHQTSAVNNATMTVNILYLKN